MGDLNFVAPIITMFFLNTYGMVNLTAAIEKLIGNPSFRPQIRIPWIFSFLGAIGCYAAMFLINWIATIIAIVISLGIFAVLARRSMQRTWGDVRSGLWFGLARYALLNLRKQPWHVKNWRPNLLVFTGQPYNREQLVEVSEWLSLGRGIVTFSQLIIGDASEMAGKGMRNAARKHINNYIEEHRMTAFAESQIVPDFRLGVQTITQSHGIETLEPNSILMGWSRDPEGRLTQMQILDDLFHLEKSVLFLNYNQDRGFGERKRIDVWWGGRDLNAELMLLLSHLITRHRTWHNAQIRILQVVNREEGRTNAENHISTILEDGRVSAHPEILVRETSRQPISEIMQKYSQDTDLTLLGMKVPAEEDFAAYGKTLNELVESIGTVLLVRNAQQESLLETG